MPLKIIAQTIQTGTTLLQVMATFSLIWAAAVGYLFKEIRRLKESKIRMLQNSESDRTSYTSEGILTLTIIGTLAGGIVLSLITLQTSYTLSQQFGPPLSRVLYSIPAILSTSTFFIYYILTGMIDDLQKFDILSTDYSMTNIAFLSLVFALCVGVFLYYFAGI